jgi:hypothetical protein
MKFCSISRFKIILSVYPALLPHRLRCSMNHLKVFVVSMLVEQASSLGQKFVVLVVGSLVVFAAFGIIFSL